MAIIYNLMSGNAQPTTYLLERYLLLQGQGSHKNYRFKCKFYYSTQLAAIDFSATFSAAAEQYSQISDVLEGTQLFYVDQSQQTKHFLGNYPFEGQIAMSYHNWSATTIHIIYRKIDSPIKECFVKTKPPKKSRERTIKEVRESLVLWRQIYQRGEQGKKPVSLVRAAQSIGMSKKSLDDYLRFLRLGEMFHFDFQRFEDHKMGVLRTYVRDKIRESQSQILPYVDLDSYLDFSTRIQIV